MVFDLSLKSLPSRLESIAFIPFLKLIKYYLDSKFRKSVIPIEGSVVYSPLYVLVEHSGIYIGRGKISNIVVDSILKGDSAVRLNSASEFVDRSYLGNKIYVSCDSNGKPVGNKLVATKAKEHVGESHFYGLVYSNCHTFSMKCLKYSPYHYVSKQKSNALIINDNDIKLETPDYESSTDLPTNFIYLRTLAKNKLNATKWLLWDWENKQEKVQEPDWQEIQNLYQDQILNPQFIQQLHQELSELNEYQQEISDENIPPMVVNQLKRFGQNLQNILDVYQKTKSFLELFSESQFTYRQLKRSKTNFQGLVDEIQNNRSIQELVRKMGRNYISEERKKQGKIPSRSKDEVHGIHRSADLMCLLPNELINLDDETLENLFYARLLEQNLLTYEIQSTTLTNGEHLEAQNKWTGPIVACLDTSASMSGVPMQKAKALLFAIAKILNNEKRHLYVLLFGSEGQIKEFQMHESQDLSGLLVFLDQGFDGGTNFETPLQRAIEIIKGEKDYTKADILMISDGDCSITPKFSKYLNKEKSELDLMIYSVLCAGAKKKDSFSDEILII